MRYKRHGINHAWPGAEMTLEILHVPGCPGADLLEARLAGLLADVRRPVPASGSSGGSSPAKPTPNGSA